MPLIQFIDENTGTLDETFMSGDDAEALGLGGTLDEVNGVKGRWKRVIGEVNGFARRNVAFICHSAPRHQPGAKAYTSDGKPIIASRKEAEEFGSRIGAKYDEL